MESSWNHSDRFGAIAEAISRVPHDQATVGVGFQLRHNPTTCVRCKAQIASLELAAFVKYAETQLEEGVTVDA